MTLVHHTQHGRYWLSRQAGVLAALWARRLANRLAVPAEQRSAIVQAARYITTRNYRGALRNSCLVLVEDYRRGHADIAIGIVRVAEAFALGTVRPGSLPRDVLGTLTNDPSYYPATVVQALKDCLGVQLPPVAGNVA